MPETEYIQLSFSDIGLAVQQEANDVVNHPSHYTQGAIETIDYMESVLTEDEFRGGCKMNILKYVSRERYKNELEDLKKARWYLNRLISCLEEREEGS